MLKTIHYFYDDIDVWERGVAPVFRMCYSSWLRNCPDYEFRLWHPKMPEFQEMLDNSRFLRECYKRNMWAFVADYVRYYALYYHGGIYLDTDVELLSNFDAYLDKSFFISVEGDIFEGRDILEPAVMGSEKGHWLLKDILDIYNSNEILKQEYFIAPVVLSNYLQKKIGFKMINYPEHLRKKANDFYGNYNNRRLTDFELYKNQQVKRSDNLRIEIYPSEYFCPAWCCFGFKAFTSNTVAIHWNQSSWWKDYKQLKEIEVLRYKEWYKRVWYKQSGRVANLLTCLIPNRTCRCKLRKRIKEKIIFKS